MDIYAVLQIMQEMHQSGAASIGACFAGKRLVTGQEMKAYPEKPKGIAKKG